LQQRLVLSTVGISSLLNGLDKTEHQWRRRLMAAANQPTLSSDLEEKVNELTHRVQARLQNGFAYDNYTHKKQGNQPIGHFRVSQATRVSCTYEGGKLQLRRFGREEVVNANP